MRIQTRHSFLKLGFSLFVLFYGISYFVALPHAFATGGAFPYTTHGGGTVDGVKADGVDRALSGDPDIDPWYFESADTTEAGEYASGECSHCHEPHNSFGGIEPPPTNSSGAPYDLVDTTDAPDDYLLFGQDSNELCWYCHNYMTVSAGGPFEEGFGRWGVYQGDLIYSDSSHGKSSDFLWPGVGARDSNEVWPRAYARQPGDENKCINCHTPHGVRGAYDSGNTPASGNYDAVAAAQADVIDRQLIAREEALCLTCHDSDGPAVTDIKASVDKQLLPVGSGHPVRGYYGRHNLAGADGDADLIDDNEVPEDILEGFMAASSNTFHAECVDCHNPHAVEGFGSNSTLYPDSGDSRRGTIFQPSGTNDFQQNRKDATDNDGFAPDGVYLGTTNAGTWGVEVDTATGEILGTLDELQHFDAADPNYLYELCLKCHSAWAWDTNYTATGPTTGIGGNWNSGITAPTTTKTWPVGVMPSDYPLTDVAAEFATDNVAYHPVFAVGKNRPELSNIRNPNWCAEDGSTYLSNSSDCMPAIGNRVDLINLTGSVEGVDIYFEQTLSQTFVPPWKHTSLVTCVDCHEDSDDSAPRGPHGSNRPFILRSVDMSIDFTICASDGTDETACGSTEQVTYDSSNIVSGEETVFCLNCHRADIYTYWGGSQPDSERQILSRQPHPMANAKNDEGIANSLYNNAPRAGIGCMGCHGGGGMIASGTPAWSSGCDPSICKLGNIHGHPDGIDTRVSNNSRLIIPGANWIGFMSSKVGVDGSCAPAPGSSTDRITDWTDCADSTRSAIDVQATYDYP